MWILIPACGHGHASSCMQAWLPLFLFAKCMCDLSSRSLGKYFIRLFPIWSFFLRWLAFLRPVSFQAPKTTPVREHCDHCASLTSKSRNEKDRANSAYCKAYVPGSYRLLCASELQMPVVLLLKRLRQTCGRRPKQETVCFAPSGVLHQKSLLYHLSRSSTELWPVHGIRQWHA